MKPRQLTEKDVAAAIELCRQLNPHAPPGPEAKAQFLKILAHPGTTIWGTEYESAVVSMVTLHLMPNLTYGGRPYGLIENVITHASFRGRGFARASIELALRHAEDSGAYKVMLLTGVNNDAVGFYEKLGFSSEEKNGMIRRF